LHKKIEHTVTSTGQQNVQALNNFALWFWH